MFKAIYRCNRLKKHFEKTKAVFKRLNNGDSNRILYSALNAILELEAALKLVSEIPNSETEKVIRQNIKISELKAEIILWQLNCTVQYEGYPKHNLLNDKMRAEKSLELENIYNKISKYKSNIHNSRVS